MSISRPKRWQSALAKAGEGLSMLQQGIEELEELRTEYEEWQDSLPENLQQSALGEKLEVVVGLEFDGAVDEIENVINEAESAELPLGFGRD